MILHPGILALIAGTFISFCMLLYGSAVAVVIIRQWDYTSSSARQLRLERQTYLISTLVSYVFGFYILAVFLFIFTIDDIHGLFVGAMCATGALNANPVGWLALLSKILLFFLAGFWLALNHIDQKAEDYPFVRRKYFLLLFILPIAAADGYLLVDYFGGLEPDIITSCCGSLFGESGGVASSLAALPHFPTMIIFFFLSLLLLLLFLLTIFWRTNVLRLLLLIVAAVFLIVSMAAVISFISVYVYEMPTHHCPFDMLQHHYGYIGYPLYITLFTGVLYAMLPGLFLFAFNHRTLQDQILLLERKWLIMGMTNILISTILLIGIIMASNLTMVQ